MKLYFLRLLFIVFSASIGFFILYQALGDRNLAHIGLVSGLIIAFAAIFFEERVKKTPLRIVLGGAIGLTTGLIIANLVTYPTRLFYRQQLLSSHSLSDHQLPFRLSRFKRWHEEGR